MLVPSSSDAGAAAAARVSLCGSLAVEIGGRQVDAELLSGHKGRLLFARLVVDRDRPIGRDELIGVLWPEDAPDDPDGALSTQLTRLRRAVGHEVIRGRSQLVLDLGEHAWVDWEVVHAGVATAERLLAGGDPRGALECASAGLAIARRPLLPGISTPWLEDRRCELGDASAALLEAAASAALQLGGEHLPLAERSARELIERQPTRESGYRLLMQAHAARGNVVQALHVYDELRRFLREELGLLPGPQLIALADALRASEPAEPRPPARAAAGAPPEPRGGPAPPPAALASAGAPPEPRGGPAPPPAALAAAAARPQPACGPVPLPGALAAAAAGPQPARGPVPLPAALAAAGARPLAGRRAELRRLVAAVMAPPADRPRVLAVTGEAGIGKTRLVAEVAAHAHGAGFAVLHGRAQRDGVLAFEPVVEALRGYLDHGAALVQELLPLLAPELAELARVVPALRPLVGTPPAGDTPHLQRVCDATAALLDAAGRRHPLLLVLEDLQWADRESLLLVRQIARTARVTLLMTLRDDELDGPHLRGLLLDLHRDRALTRLALGPLDESETAALAGIHGVTPEVVALHALAGGNPFYVEELIAPHADGDPLPIGLRAALQPRLDALPSDVLAECAFRHGVVRRLLQPDLRDA